MERRSSVISVMVAVTDAPGAVAWYKRALGAVELWNQRSVVGLEIAYPFDADVSGTSSSTGYASTFARAGFKTVERRIPARPIMRHDLRAVSV